MLSTQIKKLKRIKKLVFKKGGMKGASMAAAGFSLSPLSPWNDIYINFPIAYLAASIVSLVSENLFTISLIFFYWVSNFAGLILLELGIETVLRKKKHLTRKMILLDVLASVLITAVLVYLIHIKIIQPPAAFLSW